LTAIAQNTAADLADVERVMAGDAAATQGPQRPASLSSRSAEVLRALADEMTAAGKSRDDAVAGASAARATPPGGG